MGVFRDKTALVTGAASGIGKALVEELAREKARVIATDINEKILRHASRQQTKARKRFKPGDWM